MELTLEPGSNASVFNSFATPRFSQTMGGEDSMCDPITDQCGPLMRKSSGTRYCCANTNSDCCYMAQC